MIFFRGRQAFLNPIARSTETPVDLARAVALAALLAGLILILAMVIRLVCPSSRVEAYQAAKQNEQIAEYLRATYGHRASRMVVYRQDGRAFCDPGGEEIEIP